jgi:hypothetical protein
MEPKAWKKDPKYGPLQKRNEELIRLLKAAGDSEKPPLIAERTKIVGELRSLHNSYENKLSSPSIALAQAQKDSEEEKEFSHPESAAKRARSSAISGSPDSAPKVPNP